MNALGPADRERIPVHGGGLVAGVEVPDVAVKHSEPTEVFYGCVSPGGGTWRQD